jgi:hypothetical protein
MSSPFLKASLTALAVIGVGGAVAGFASGGDVQTIHFIAVNARTTTLDFPPLGKSPGDLYVVEGTMLTPNRRRVVGRVRGSQTDIKLERGTETVQGLLTYEFGPGNEIVVGGLSAYPLKATGLIKGKKFMRPVLGGSGKYNGAKGTVTSTQLKDGSYDQVFRLTY